MKFYTYIVFILLYKFQDRLIHGLKEGELCVDKKTKEFGNCTKISNCPSITNTNRENIHPTFCTFTFTEALVCCLNNNLGIDTRNHVLSDDEIRRSNHSIFDKVSFGNPANEIPVNNITTAPEPGRSAIIKDSVAHRKCIEYGEMKNRLFCNTLRGRVNDVIWGDDDEYKIEEVGGEPVELNEFPHMAAIGWYLNNGSLVFKCGGSLISENFILTAAHCTKSPPDTELADLNPKVVRLGEHNIFSDNDGAFPIDVEIAEIIIHPKYKAPKKYYDIALIKLSLYITFTTNIFPACINTVTDYIVNNGTSTGWGSTKSGSSENSPILQKVTLDVLQNNVCDELLRHLRNRNWQGFRKHQLCAGVLAGHKDSCQGDSGGPLQVTFVTDGVCVPTTLIIGITSFGKDCGKPNLPGVYTQVSYFVDWIEQVVWGTE